MSYRILIFLFLALTIFISCKPKSTVEAATEAVSDSTAQGSTFVPNTTKLLYVHAGKGVVLRATPGADGAKIATLAYGTTVETSSSETTGSVYVAERVGPHELSGKWLKVKMKDGKEGYVFERYVFPFPTHVADYGEQSYFEWFYQQFAPEAKIELTTDDSTSFQEGAIDGRTTIFDDGAEYEFAMFEGGISEFLRIPLGKMTIEDALVIFRAAHFRADENITTSYDETLKSIFVNGETSAVQIQEKDGFLEIAIHAT